jgi:hypothetical protein
LERGSSLNSSSPRKIADHVVVALNGKHLVERMIAD